MNNKNLYEQLLGLKAPWKVTGVELDPLNREVRVRVEYDRSKPLCPTCNKVGVRGTTRERRWQHLNTCEFKTYITAGIPRVHCREHGTLQIPLPWADPHSRFTLSLEQFAIDVLLATTISDAARLTGLSWNQLARIQERAVERGLARREQQPVSILGVDETSFRKRHRYMTIVTDLDRDRVLHVADERTEDSLTGFYEGLGDELLAQIDVVAIDMWGPYITATQKHVPSANTKIAFDKFHVAKHLGDAVNRVRREEHRELQREGDDRLKGSRHLWLTNPQNMRPDRWQDFARLRKSSLRTARAWALKETAMDLWHYVHRGWATKQWEKWIQWARRSRLEPMKKTASTIKNHLFGIVNAVVLGVTSAGAEGMNSKIQKLKSNANGFRNADRFKAAILFHFGGLDLSPGPVS